MSFYKNFPDKETLLKSATASGNEYYKVNAHLHTPFSFSAFDELQQALDMAKVEGVKVVGVNDFYSTDGYAEWAEESLKRKLFPLFNIEFISLNKEDQANGIRVNDPNNPGRTYLSGKGLAYPLILKDPYLKQLQDVAEESNQHVAKMCAKLNEILIQIGSTFILSYDHIKKNMTSGSVRERHLAKALRMNVELTYATAEEQMAFYEKVFGGKALKSNISDSASVENEIRGNLLKAGGGAFVPEDPKAFLEMEVVRQIILNAGGMPTYPFLADDAKGGFTDFEEDLPKTAAILKKRGIASVEFITTRNSVEVLEKYGEYLYNEGFVVTFGSEHNTPAMEPITLFARNSTPLSDKLMDLNYKGACITAAHQYLVATEGKGYLDMDGKADLPSREEYVKLGRALINYVINN